MVLSASSLSFATLALACGLVSARVNIFSGLMSPECSNTFFVEKNFFDSSCQAALLSKVLGLVVIAGSFVLKLPQILVIIRAQDVTGISLTSLVLDVLVFASSVVYNLVSGYPLVSYGESFVILIQNVVLVILFWVYSNPPTSVVANLAMTVSFVIILVGMFFVPQEYRFILSVAGIPLGLASKIPQIISNFSVGHTGQLSLATLALNLAGSSARLFTTFQEVGNDMSLLLGFGTSAALNFTLVLQVILFSSRTSKVLAEQAAKKSKRD